MSSCISQPSQAVGLQPGPLKGITALSAAKGPALQAAPQPLIYTTCNMMSYEAVLLIYRGQSDRKNAALVPQSSLSTRPMPISSRGVLLLTYGECTAALRFPAATAGRPLDG